MAIEGGYGSAAQFQLMASAAQAATGQIGNLIQNIAAVQAAVGTITFAARAFASLEQQLTLTNAVAEGTAKQFNEMSNAVRDAALAMKFSATEGANALYFLASAGLSVQQSMSALQGVMLLAQATMTDVGMAADTVASALSAFQLKADQSTRVANLFAAAMAQSQADINKLAFSMRQVAPIAGAMGVSIEKTTAALSVLYNVGLRGEQAGTALRNILVNLQNPTAEASDALYKMGIATQTTTGHARDLFDMIQELSRVNPNLGTLKTLFGADALAGAQALLNAANADRYQAKLTPGTSQYDEEFAQRAEQIAARVGKSAKDIRDELTLTLAGESGTNSAYTIAAKQMATLSGSFATARNSVMELGISLGENLAPSLRTIANTITDLGIAFRGLSTHQQNMITQLPLIAAGAFGAFKALGALSDGVGSLSRVLAGAGGGIAAGTSLGGTAVAAAGYAMGAFGPRTQEGSIRNAREYYTTGRDDAVQRGLSTVPAAASGANFAAASTASAVARIAVGVTGIGLTLLAIYEVGKFIFDYLKIDRSAKSELPVANMGADAVRQAQSLTLTVRDPAERIKQLEELRKSTAEQRKGSQELEDSYNRQAQTANKRIEELRKQAGLAGSTTTALNSQGQMVTRSTPGVDREALIQALIGEGNKPVPLNSATDVAGVIEKLSRSMGLDGSTDMFGGRAAGAPDLNAVQLREIQAELVKLNQQRANIKQTSANTGGLRDADVAIGSQIDTARSAPDAAAAIQKANLQKEVEAEAARAQFNYINDKFIDGFEKDARAAQNSFQQLRARLSSDPLEVFLAEQSSARSEFSSKIKTVADKARTDLTTALGSVSAGKGDISRMLSGADFFEDMLVTDANGAQSYKPNPDRLQKSVAGMIEAGGFTKEQILAQYDAVVKEANARMAGSGPEIRSTLDRITTAQRTLFENMIAERDLKVVQDLRNLKQDSQAKRDYVVAMRERLVSGQQEVFKALAVGASEIDPGITLGNGIREAFSSMQGGRNQLQQFEDAYYRTFAPVGSDTQTTANAAAQFAKYKDSFTSNLNKLFVTQIDTLVSTARSARAKALDTLRSNAADIKAQQAAIAEELYIYSGDPSFLAQAVTSDAAQAAADAERTIAGLRERARTIQTNVGKLQAANGTTMNSMPDLQVPVATQNFQTRLVELQTTANQKLEQIVANTANFGAGGGQSGASGSRTMPGATAGSFGLGGVTSVGAVAANQSDMEKVIRTVYAEASGEGERGMQAVAEVIRNRAATWNKSPGDIATQNNGTTFQFEPWKPSSSGYQRMMDFDVNSDKGQQIRQIVQEVFAGTRQDVTGGAMNFLNASTVRDRGTYNNPNGLPDWAQGGSTRIGNHDFFNPTAKTMPVPIDAAAAAAGAGVQTTANDNKAASESTRILTTDQQALRDEYLKVLNITGTYSNDLNVLIPQLKAQGVSTENIARLQELVSDKSDKLVEGNKREYNSILALIDSQIKLAKARQTYLSSPGYEAYKSWELEGKAIDAMGKSMERSGSIADGLQYGIAKARHNVSTDFQLAADGFASLTDKGAGILGGLITGTEKDWKASVANMLNDIANAIAKALILRALLGNGAGAAGGESGGLMGGLFSGLGSLFGGGATSLAGGMPAAASAGGIDPFSLIASAKGNVFGPGASIIQHSKGDIVGSKQYFPMANGGVGSIAENGSPEAIMPLTRGRGGRLGIEVITKQDNAANANLVPITGNPRAAGGMGNMTFAPSFSYMGGNAGGGQGNGGQASMEQQQAMTRDFNNEMESAFNRFIDRQKAPGGQLYEGGRKYG